jgi:hypothetical protein
VTDSPKTKGTKGPPTWAKCRQSGCIGRSIGSGSCLAHANDNAQRAFLTDLTQGKEGLRLPGTPISSELLARVLDAVPKTADGRPELRNAWFERASFTGEALFADVQFTGDAIFQEATFASLARFEGAQFAGEAWFNEAVFENGALFQRAGFSCAAWMHYARFLGIGATFFGTRFDSDASFRMARFAGHATFGDAVFAKEAAFDDVVIAKMMLFTEASFTAPVLIQGIMKQLVCYKAQFSGGVTIRLGGAQVALDQTELGPLSMMSSLRGTGRTNVLRVQANSIGIDESLVTARPRAPAFCECVLFVT